MGIKMAGAILLIGSTTLIGHTIAKRREVRVRQLAAIIHSLERLETEVVYGLAYLAEAFTIVGRDCPETSRLYDRARRTLQKGGTARDAWCSGVAAYRPYAFLTEDDVKPLERVGAVLGLSSADDQQRHLRHVRKQLETELERAQRELPQRMKLCRALGLLGGMTAAMFLF